MRQPFILFLYLTATFSLVVGCTSREEVVSASPSPKQTGPSKVQDAAALMQKNPVFVFHAKYYRTKGPCIRIGDTLAMPVVDAFKVVKMVKGTMQAKTIIVRTLSHHGPRYPKQLAEGKVYTLRLTPSEGTKRQLRGNEKDGSSFIWIDGDEIEEKKADK